VSLQERLDLGSLARLHGTELGHDLAAAHDWEADGSGTLNLWLAAGLLFEESTAALLCGDLFTQTGNTSITTGDIVGPAIGRPVGHACSALGVQARRWAPYVCRTVLV
jgi:hypothetical protein